ncbi:MAG TPA: hypothetical protein VNN73_13870 [Blastocatellia bacterium]|nr:hypothetical protein [Blastocatellia bacterium]
MMRPLLLTLVILIALASAPGCNVRHNLDSKPSFVSIKAHR